MTMSISYIDIFYCVITNRYTNNAAGLLILPRDLFKDVAILFRNKQCGLFDDGYIYTSINPQLYCNINYLSH